MAPGCTSESISLLLCKEEGLFGSSQFDNECLSVSLTACIEVQQEMRDCAALLLLGLREAEHREGEVMSEPGSPKRPSGTESVSPQLCLSNAYRKCLCL